MNFSLHDFVGVAFQRRRLFNRNERNLTKLMAENRKYRMTHPFRAKFSQNNIIQHPTTTRILSMYHNSKRIVTVTFVLYNTID